MESNSNPKTPNRGGKKGDTCNAKQGGDGLPPGPGDVSFGAVFGGGFDSGQGESQYANESVSETSGSLGKKKKKKVKQLT